MQSEATLLMVMQERLAESAERKMCWHRWDTPWPPEEGQCELLNLLSLAEVAPCITWVPELLEQAEHPTDLGWTGSMSEMVTLILPS